MATRETIGRWIKAISTGRIEGIGRISCGKRREMIETTDGITTDSHTNHMLTKSSSDGWKKKPSIKPSAPSGRPNARASL